MQAGMTKLERGDEGTARPAHNSALGVVLEVNGVAVLYGDTHAVVAVLDDWLHQATLVQAGGDLRFGSEVEDRGPAVRPV